ncbi:MAG: hypothetical protein UX49_C0016G0029 [Candidatus Wolfebacteria bacterium GW2011_GWC2_46_275]|uniref:Uncharacterized protein n=1 Tax=Candidatus Wolfebacteria bacterium GW2011_GWB1_47_1 TaxID=1619007 RepID=A0A0G4ARJ3_9BACT|nr:MAG: hypothetical protein UX70_C0001G0015 [Candidatus Wolfebacteria bacterium GW2011_GWB1_47_1]KKU36436.1 MAG: hypothetical protein UX49_C0016G0029 [Candidatus Wolfebacteria bacterium GW2011_GWC2_46_275]KKU41749.1 MAG: hypothetical protein UX58_C0006G0058 [Candidatus Wolfebacteria bacterium GW2011_GWB2_46_69]KKU53957.1 MAG: hypothetical protein UX76_C0007G0016 [Candidatus Wolfebacteria bacterium GW2011_GWC1_47_103]KKU72101.1 MAG: hypothetical protein UX96_C0017G0029 [Candidatus Wolfebacteria
MINFTTQEIQAEKELRKRTKKAIKEEAIKRKTTLVRIRSDLHARLRAEAKMRKIVTVRLLDEVVESFFQ